eukprot:scaffold174557_cov32-Tisochrysis_lutea.AAC.3
MTFPDKPQSPVATPSVNGLAGRGKCVTSNSRAVRRTRVSPCCSATTSERRTVPWASGQNALRETFNLSPTSPPGVESAAPPAPAGPAEEHAAPPVLWVGEGEAMLGAAVGKRKLM